MTLNPSRNFSKLSATATLLLASASLIGQQAAPSPSTSNASKKHLAGVKYEPMAVQGATQNPPKTEPSPASPQTAKRRDGAIVAADFNKRESGAPLKGVGTASQAKPDATAAKGTGSTGIPVKAASPNDKTDGAPIKGVIYKRGSSNN
jgi:hypothetical protein